LKTLVIAIVPLLVTGLLAVLGNWLIQRWQQRNWITQHTLEKAEKELGELRKSIDELLRLASARVYRMQRVVKNLRSTSEAFATIKQEYDQAVVNWNDRLNTIYIDLRLYADYHYTDRLYQSIQPQFVEISEALDKAIKQRSATPVNNSVIVDLERRLNALSGAIFDIGKDLLRLLRKKQSEAYEGALIIFSLTTLELFPRWYLFKALFQPLYPRAAVSSAALNFTRPIIRRT